MEKTPSKTSAIEKEKQINNERRSAHSIKHNKGSKTSLSTIPEETKSHTTDAVHVASLDDDDIYDIFSSQSVEEENKEARVSSTSLLLQEKLQDEKQSGTPLKKIERRKLKKRKESAEDPKYLLSHSQSLSHMPLFPTVLSDQDSQPALDTTFLITGFGLRNLKSVQMALQEEEKKRLMELYKANKDRMSHSSLSHTSMITQKSQRSDSSQTEISTTTESTSLSDRSSLQRKKIEYLMGILPCEEEEYEEEKKPSLEEIAYAESIDEGITGITESTRQAQKYLRNHHIFEFFQFLICHMLSAFPDNPIEFLMEILDKCLMYRSGFGEPPLLYTKKHLEQLFYLMDRMRTGFIDLEQYKTGMTTIGICFYNESPLLTSDGLVTKEIFIQEAYECLTNLLNDMIRRRWIGMPPPIIPPPPPTPLVCSLAGSYVDGDYHIGGGAE